MFYIIEFRIAINEIRKCVFESTDCFNDNPLVFNEGQKVYYILYMQITGHVFGNCTNNLNILEV